MLERLARDGCSSIAEYAQMSPEFIGTRLGDIQYKNLTLIAGELDMLLTDLIPVIDRPNYIRFKGMLDKIKKTIRSRDLYVQDIYSSSKSKVTETRITSYFNDAFEYLVYIKREIILELAPILFIKRGEVNNPQPY